MKKLSLLLIIGAVAFAGCSDNGGGDDPGTTPKTFTSKVLLEYFSGAWCPYCPDGKVYENNIRASVNPNQFMSVVYHNSAPSIGRYDMMDILYDNPIEAKFAAGYPTGMINRISGKSVNRGLWADQVNGVLAEKAMCGLAINTTKTGGDVDVTVKLAIGEADMPEGNYFLTCLLIEKEVVGSGQGYDQANAYSKDNNSPYTTHPYYNYPIWIQGYQHTNVCRAVLSNALGDPISADALKAGKETQYTFTTDATGFDSDLQIIAFLSEFTDKPQTPEVDGSYVWNTQIVDVGSNKDFD